MCYVLLHFEPKNQVTIIIKLLYRAATRSLIWSTLHIYQIAKGATTTVCKYLLYYCSFRVSAQLQNRHIIRHNFDKATITRFLKSDKSHKWHKGLLDKTSNWNFRRSAMVDQARESLATRQKLNISSIFNIENNHTVLTYRNFML